MPVDRCICHNISFSQVKRIAEERGFASIEELRVERVCSTNCQLCEPYIQQMFETGETIFQPELQNRVME